MEIDGYEIGISRTDKLFFPGEGITKGDIVDYYARIADTMLPYMRGRPISMERFPDGIGEEGFYQKEIPDYFPAWVDRAEVRLKEGEGETQPQVVCEKRATLVYLADQGCITPHIWLSRKDKLDRPDKMMFDLDPPGEAFAPVRIAALALKELLDALDIPSFVMTTGSRGVHVVVHLERGQRFAFVRTFARVVAEVLTARHPDTLTTEVRKEEREDRVFLDTLRNAYGQTSVTPYAVRARKGAPIAAPLDWDELKRRELHSQSYTITNIFRRLGQKEDPWKGIFRHAISLETRLEALEELLEE
jgi:bifunctional non-homologous end joining protein LigD